jgi:hypothetical protein
MEALVDIHFEKDDAASIPLHQSIEDYIKSNHARDENGKFRYSSSTLRTWLSVFKKWYEITGEYPAEIKQICTRLENCHMKDWNKQEVVKKAFALEAEEITRYLELPDDEVTLVRKAWAVISKALAGRHCETHPLLEESVEAQKDPRSGEDTFLVHFDRKKRREAKQFTRYQGAFVTGAFEVGVLKRYFATRALEQPQKSMWRYLLMNKKTGKITMTNNNIGINATKQFGKDSATALKIPNPERYTGHWARTAAINVGIENGGTVEQMVAMTGIN